MKTIHVLTAIIVLVFLGASCVENSGKYKTLASERDSLQLQAQNLEASYNETIGILNDVEESFAQIREAEGKMMLDVQRIEGDNITKRKQIAFQMEQIKDLLAQNKARIDELQRQSSQRGRDNASLKATINRMQTELEEKTAFIASLQGELEKKNIKIEELSTSVDQLSTDLTQLSEVSEKQEEMLKNQDENLNTVWYIVASYSDLKDYEILNTNGLFRRSTVLDQEFDKTAFTEADKRDISVIPTNSRRVRVMTPHPQESYSLTKDDDRLVSIEIIDPEKFWSISKYLVVKD